MDKKSLRSVLATLIPGNGISVDFKLPFQSVNAQTNQPEFLTPDVGHSPQGGAPISRLEAVFNGSFELQRETYVELTLSRTDAKRFGRSRIKFKLYDADKLESSTVRQPTAAMV